MQIINQSAPRGPSLLCTKNPSQSSTPIWNASIPHGGICSPTLFIKPLNVDIIDLNKNSLLCDFKNKTCSLKANLHHCWVTAIFLMPSND